MSSFWGRLLFRSGEACWPNAKEKLSLYCTEAPGKKISSRTLIFSQIHHQTHSKREKKKQSSGTYRKAAIMSERPLKLSGADCPTSNRLPRGRGKEEHGWTWTWKWTWVHVHDHPCSCSYCMSVSKLIFMFMFMFMVLWVGLFERVRLIFGRKVRIYLIFVKENRERNFFASNFGYPLCFYKIFEKHIYKALSHF